MLLRLQAIHQERSGGGGNQAQLSGASIKQGTELSWGSRLCRTWEVFKIKMPSETYFGLFHRKVHFFQSGQPENTQVLSSEGCESLCNIIKPSGNSEKGDRQISGGHSDRSPDQSQ